MKRLLSYDELDPKKGIPYCPSHLWRMEQRGDFPRRVRLGGNRIAWVEAEIDQWIADRIAERDTEAA